jgi:hypothetical protein
MLLGHVTYDDRTLSMHEAADQAHAEVPAIARASLPAALDKGQSVRLFDAWKRPEVVADAGIAFDRIHQLTGSCVWAGGTNALFSTIAAQRVAGVSPTKAFIPFTLHNYADSRRRAGMTRQGDGSMGSTFAASLHALGVRDWARTGASLPTWSDGDGISVAGSSVEYAWSVTTVAGYQDVVNVAAEHKLGSAAACESTADIQAAIVNGYGVSFACDRYIGNASVQGGGGTAYLRGRWDTNGGHQQSIHAVWSHPTDGLLFWAQNNWPGSTYPRDPAGGPVCGCWVREADVAAAMGYHGEVYAFSALDWFPAQPAVIDWASI